MQGTQKTYSLKPIFVYTGYSLVKGSSCKYEIKDVERYQIIRPHLFTGTNIKYNNIKVLFFFKN